ncbi:MAG: nicotinate-nucleotide--dimethylbenzimidazole phosphoribosyltransferase [Fibrobacteria bacterium]|nr:nicotinate-nucleotide--dimethylbenzimidazole phosphoribosyltransferase [Fibrobacteria bacterium]
MSKLYKETLEAIVPVSTTLKSDAWEKMNFKTKPLGALGRIENLAVQMSLIQESLNPEINQKALFVFAGDHGVAASGVSAYPAEVTPQMVMNFLNGGAAINVLCRHHNIGMSVVDMGVNADFEPHPDLIDKKVRKGTRNFLKEPAMTEGESLQALENGMSVFLEVHKKSPVEIIGLGDMGIGNTTSATAIICAVTGINVAESAGRGTGVDDEGLEKKINVIKDALSLHKPEAKNGLDILCRVGGLEIAGIAGAVLAAASQKVAVVLDGVISTAAGLIAYLINPDVQGYLISGHKSIEKSQVAALEKMKLVPVIDLDMRLGEGTGAALAINIAEAACKIMCEMSSFADAGVSEQNLSS